jgi:predicted metal-dependent peptidase
MAAANGKDPDLMNRAMDYAVNAILKADGFYLKPEWLYDQRFENMTWQEIYKILERPGQGGQGKGKQPGQPGGQQGQGQPGKSPAAWGAVTAPPPGKVEEQASDWRIAVQQAIQAARSCGSVPAGIEQLVEITKGPRASWFDRLKRFVAATVVTDYTWSRPSRRTASLGIYLPSTTKEGTGHIDVAIDCSGSISDRELEEFGSKFDALHEELKPELVRAIYFDAVVQNVKEFGPEDAVTFDVKGRGGTDVRSAFKWIEESGRQPKCLVVLTDLETPFPDMPPSYPVLWITVNQHTPPFGDCAFMEVN